MFNGDPVPDEIKCDIIKEEMCVQKLRKEDPPKVHDIDKIFLSCLLYFRIIRPYTFLY